MEIATRHQKLLDEIGLPSDLHERLGLIVEKGRAAGDLDDASKVPENAVPGCISPVWLVGEEHKGRWHFQVAADAPMVRGLAACLLELYDGGTKAEIQETEPVFLQDLGILQQLSPTRKNGLLNLRKRFLKIVND